MLAQGAALLKSIVKLLATLPSFPALAITRQLSHYIGSTRWFIPQQITKHVFVHKCSKLVKLAATLQLAISEPLLKLLMPRLLLDTSRVSFQVFRAWSMCCTAAQCASVLQNWFATVSFHLQLQKLYCRGIRWWCWTNQRPN